MDILPSDSKDINDVPRKLAVKRYRNQDQTSGESGSPLQRGQAARENAKMQGIAKRVPSAVEEKVDFPKKPAKGSPIDRWFDYYYQSRQKGLNVTLKDLAEETGYQLSYLKLLLRQYRREHQLE